MSKPQRYRFDVDGDTFVQLADYQALRARFDELLSECRMIHKIAARRDWDSLRVVDDVAFQLSVAIENAEKECE